MRKKLFYLKNGRRLSGPFSQEQLNRMQEKGLLVPGDMISENRISWTSARDFFAPEPEEKVEEEKIEDKIEIQLYQDAPSFPDAEKDLQPDDPPETPQEEAKKIRILPDPICSAIAMCWNASGQLANIYLSHTLAADSDPAKSVRDNKIFSGTIIIMLIIIIGVPLTLIGTALPKYFLAVGIMPLVLFFAVSLLIFIENLLLSFGIKQNKMIEMPLMYMQLLLTALPAFIGGLPLYGLLICGIRHCPMVLTSMIVIHSSLFLFYSLLNSAFGFWQINNHVFKFRRVGAIFLIILFTIQHLMLYPIGILLYNAIQK